MNPILKDRSFQLSIVLTLIFLGTGIAFLFFGLADYSWILFVLLPFALGIAVGTMEMRRYALRGTIVTTIITLIALYVPGLSGLICIVMAIVLVVPIVLLGYVIVRLVKRYKEIKDSNRMSVLLLPLLPFMLAAPTEHFLKKEKETIIPVSTERIFYYTPEQVYDAIKCVDTLDAEKPWLMSFDLPVPTKCVLDKEEIGGIRTCYFDKGNLSNADFGGGTIVEKITEMEHGRLLKMDVIDYNLIGRNWLGFKEAIYQFEPIGDSACRLVRITTYSSVLTPRFYWEPMEKLGIDQEHQYVFNNLEKGLKRIYGEK